MDWTLCCQWRSDLNGGCTYMSLESDRQSSCHMEQGQGAAFGEVHRRTDTGCRQPTCLLWPAQRIVVYCALLMGGYTAQLRATSPKNRQPLPSNKKQVASAMQPFNVGFVAFALAWHVHVICLEVEGSIPIRLTFRHLCAVVSDHHQIAHISKPSIGGLQLL